MAFTNTFTTTEGVIDWVHRHTTNGWTDTLPTTTTGFTPIDVFIICVTNLTDACFANGLNFSNFA